jgi:DNA-binding IclR family transcriptional regulator
MIIRTPVGLELMQQEWREEQLRYAVLKYVYERAGQHCEVVVKGSEIGAALDLRYENLFRITHFLERRGYLAYLGEGPRVCITFQGIEYMEVLAGRRRSIRD